MEDNICSRICVLSVSTCCRKIISLMFVLWLSSSQACCRTVTAQLLREKENLNKAWLEACDLFFSNVNIILHSVTSELDCKDRFDMSLQAHNFSQIYLSSGATLWPVRRGLCTIAVAPVFQTKLNKKNPMGGLALPIECRMTQVEQLCHQHNFLQVVSAGGRWSPVEHPWGFWKGCQQNIQFNTSSRPHVTSYTPPPQPRQCH